MQSIYIYIYTPSTPSQPLLFTIIHPVNNLISVYNTCTRTLLTPLPPTYATIPTTARCWTYSRLWRMRLKCDVKHWKWIKMTAMTAKTTTTTGATTTR